MRPVRLHVLLIALAGLSAACSSEGSPVVQAASTTPTAPTTTVAGATTTTPTTAVVVRALALGDGRRSTAPEAGSVFSCQMTFSAAAGAFRDGPWIKGDGTWDPTAKIAVQGSVAWPQGQYSMGVEGANRVITTNGVPTQQTTGVFPVDANDPAYQYDRNPNTITPRAVTYTLPASPAAAAAPTCVNMGAIGVLVDGVALFNALDAQGRDAAAHETLDHCDGHPERSGQYHHHTVPTCMLAQSSGASTLVGWALDGFGVYIERQANGSLLTNADLDGCHGRSGPVAWDGQTVTMYHYVATLEYPYTVGCFQGTPRR